MSLSDLFTGQTPAATTTYNQNLNSIPSWLLNDTNSLISQATAVAGTPYQQSPVPQVAPWSADQSQAQQQVEQQQGSWKPGLAAATATAQGATDPTQFNAAYGYLPQAAQQYKSALTPGAAQMNPYINNVITNAQNQASQYWNNSLLPSIDQQYAASGQAGSSANTRALGQAGAQVTQNLQDTSNAALASGYSNAQQAGMTAAGGLSALGQTQGGLAYEQGMLGLQGAGTQAALASQGQQMGYTDANTLYNVGSAQQNQGQTNLNSQNAQFLAQTQYPESQLSWLSQIIGGTASPSTTGYATSGTNSGYLPGAQYGASPINQAMGIYSGLSALGTPS